MNLNTFFLLARAKQEVGVHTIKVKLENLTKRFGEIVAVKDLNLEIMEGEFLVIVGPTGCGKTTLLRLIAGLERPDSGNLYIDGELMNDVGPGRRGVQMIFQNYALWPHMKVFDEKSWTNLSFGLKVRKLLRDEISKRIDEVTSRVGIEKRLFDRKPDQLSEGQKQKVAVGRALSTEPKVYLMDDPLTNLDPQSRVKVRTEILRIHNELRTTTVYVTHNLADAMVMADRMAVMKEGTIEQVDTPQTVYDHPVNEFVADFIKCYDFARVLERARN